MIKSNKGQVVIKGEIDEVFAEYSTLTKSFAKMLVENGGTEEQAKEDLKQAFELAFMTKEEIFKGIIEMLEKHEKECEDDE